MGVKGGNSLLDEDYATFGPFTAMFGNAVARVLDQSFIVGNMEQTISMLVESTALSYKTVEKAIHRLEPLGFIRFTRKIGNAKAYKFEVENHLSELLDIFQKIQLSRTD